VGISLPKNNSQSTSGGWAVITGDVQTSCPCACHDGMWGSGYLHLFLTVASCPSHFNPRERASHTHWMRGVMSMTAIMNTSETSLASAGNQTMIHCRLVTVWYTVFLLWSTGKR
jgi:hypothetical protein